MSDGSDPADHLRSRGGPRARRRTSARKPFELDEHSVRAGSVARIEIPIARLPAGTWSNLPITVIHGREEGPTVWLNAAIHGDELGGIAIVREVVKELDPRHLAGTVLAVPIVNVFGLTHHSRYLPDRRDLNRAFPGSARGSLAAQIAHLFLEKVVAHSDYGIDFHTGSAGRSNLPQLRCGFDDPVVRELAEAFGAPVVVDATLRDGSLRAAASSMGIPVLLYEAGEADRFESWAIDPGVQGTLRVLGALGMVSDPPRASISPIFCRTTTWVRATHSGFHRPIAALGDRIEPSDLIARVEDSSGQRSWPIRARRAGVLVGQLRSGIVYKGDAVAHIASE